MKKEFKRREDWQPPPIPGLRVYAPEELEALARRYGNEVEGWRVGALEPALTGRFWTVFSGEDLKEPEDPRGWIVAGDLPFAAFNGKLCTTPEEAIAAYGWFIRQWQLVCGRAMRKSPREDLMPVVATGTWEPVLPTTEYFDWLSPRRSSLVYVELSLLTPRVFHPELRERLHRMNVPLLPMEEREEVEPSDS